MQLFAVAVKAGSFSAAAREIGITPSAVSRAVAALEAQLGVRLFRRTTRRMALTEPGRIYYAHVVKILRDVEEARRAVQEHASGAFATIRLAVPAGTCRAVLRRLRAFREGHPEVRIVISVGARGGDPAGEDCDLVLRIGRAPRQRGLAEARLAAGRRLLCASPEYLKAAGEPQAPGELAEHLCIGWADGAGREVWRLRGPSGVTEVEVRSALFIDGFEALVAAALAGLGLVLIPDWAAVAELEEGRLRRVLPGYQAVPPAVPLYAAYDPRRGVGETLGALIDQLSLDEASGSA